MKKAWIFQGGWDGHEPKLTSKRFSDMLQKYDYETSILDTLTPLEDLNALLQLDLLVFCWTMGEIQRDYTQNLAKGNWRGGRVGRLPRGACATVSATIRNGNSLPAASGSAIPVATVCNIR